MLRRCQLKVFAKAGANHHTMRSFPIGYAHSGALHTAPATNVKSPNCHADFPTERKSSNRTVAGLQYYWDSPDVKLKAFNAVHTKLQSRRFELWTDGSSSFSERTLGAAALLYEGKQSSDQPLEICHAASGPLACSYKAECLALERGLSHLLIPALHDIHEPSHVLIATGLLSAIEALRLGPLAFH
ncbi:hypothetical protein LSM04_008086 [Trypanosoma melophagium]|uniref:uncharacterized protein n=1 Tax=Trypanosoma melophagium TaxID=715481 RepID=UPI00351AA6C8|nr:hypothetical protein LSM04_008086 [Trypanosoma melophagium]